MKLHALTMTYQPDTCDCGRPVHATVPLRTGRNGRPQPFRLCDHCLELEMNRQPTPDILTDLLHGPPPAAETVRTIPVERLRANPYQRRTIAIADADPSLIELSSDIALHSIHQPLVVRPDPGEPGCYQIAAGHRRHAAARLAGLSTVPCIVRPLDDRQMLDVVFSENYHRADISPIDRAHLIQEYVDAGLTHQQIADRLSLSRPTVSNALRLLKLPDYVQASIISGAISQRQADALLPLTTLPEANIKRLSEWDSLGHIVKMAKDGVSSDSVRERVNISINNATRALHDHWSNYNFQDLDGIVTARCTDCVQVIRNAGQTRCLGLPCWDRKSSAWQAIENAELVAKTGVLFLPEVIDYREYDVLYSPQRSLLELPEPPAPPTIQPVCNNLRLRRAPYTNNFEYVCYHPDKKNCACLAAIERTAATTGKTAWQAISRATSYALSVHLQTFTIDALRLLAWQDASGRDRRTLGQWTAEQCIAQIVPRMIGNHTPYEPTANIPETRRAMQALLTLAGVADPFILAGNVAASSDILEPT